MATATSVMRVQQLLHRPVRRDRRPARPDLRPLRGAGPARVQPRGPAVDVADRRAAHGAPDERDEHRAAAGRPGARRAGAQPRRPPRGLRGHHGCRSRRRWRPSPPTSRRSTSACRCSTPSSTRPLFALLRDGAGRGPRLRRLTAAVRAWRGSRGRRPGFVGTGSAFVMVEGSPEPGRVSGPPRRQQGHPFHGHHRQARRRRAPGPRRPGAHRRRGLVRGRAGQLGHRGVHRAPGHRRPACSSGPTCSTGSTPTSSSPRRRRPAGRCGWRWRTPPTPTAVVGDSKHVAVTGVSVRDWTLLTTTTGTGTAPRARCRRPVAPAGRGRGPGDPHRRAVRVRPRRWSSRARAARSARSP